MEKLLAYGVQPPDSILKLRTLARSRLAGRWDRTA